MVRTALLSRERARFFRGRSFEIEVYRFTFLCLGKFDHNLTVPPRPGNYWFILGKSSPFMAELFSLAKYCNLPRYVPEVLQNVS